MPKHRKMLLNIKDSEQRGYRCSQCQWKFVSNADRAAEIKREITELAMQEFDRHRCSDFPKVKS
jgi:hypothetical protein